MLKTIFIKLIHIITLLVYFNLCIQPDSVRAQDTSTTTPTEEHVTVGETTVTYIIPAPPTLNLTPPTILGTPPEGARIYPLSTGGIAPFNGILLNGEAAAWLEIEHETAPRYIQEYSDAIEAQMVAWTYLQIRTNNLQIATEREQARIRLAGLEREIATMRRLERRNKVRPALIVGIISVVFTFTITLSSFYIIENRRN